MQLNQKRGAKLTQSGRLFQCCIVRYSAIPPGQFSIGANSQEANACIELGCWSHSRRKFFDLHNANASAVALEALTRIAKLYEIEQQGKALSISERKHLRALKSKPALTDLADWLTGIRAKTANGGGLAKALDYTFRHPDLRDF